MTNLKDLDLSPAFRSNPEGIPTHVNDAPTERTCPVCEWAESDCSCAIPRPINDDPTVRIRIATAVTSPYSQDDLTKCTCGATIVGCDLSDIRVVYSRKRGLRVVWCPFCPRNM